MKKEREVTAFEVYAGVFAIASCINGFGSFQRYDFAPTKTEITEVSPDACARLVDVSLRKEIVRAIAVAKVSLGGTNDLMTAKQFRDCQDTINAAINYQTGNNQYINNTGNAYLDSKNSQYDRWSAAIAGMGNFLVTVYGPNALQPVGTLPVARQPSQVQRLTFR